MPEGRGKKAKKARWQVVLGLKQVLCGALGLAWMMVIIFILGVLAGRGDIYHWLSSWGLVSPEAQKIAQWSPPAEAPPALPPAAAPAKPSPAAPAAAPAIPSPAPAMPPPAPSASPGLPPPVTGSLAAVPAPTASPAKKGKKGASPRDQKSKEEDLRRLRQEMASKLRFQNSFDSTPAKPARTAQKQKDKAAAAPKAQPKQVRVALLRDAKAAKAKLAELQKKGEKVSLKQGKDQKGAYYEIVRETPAGARQTEPLAQKTQKSGGTKPKQQTNAGN